MSAGAGAHCLRRLLPGLLSALPCLSSALMHGMEQAGRPLERVLGSFLDTTCCLLPDPWEELLQVQQKLSFSTSTSPVNMWRDKGQPSAHQAHTNGALSK